MTKVNTSLSPLCLASVIVYLFTASRATFLGTDLQASFQLTSSSDTCPSVIDHLVVGNIDPLKYYVHHSDIVHDGTNCTGSNFIAIILRNVNVTAKTASATDSFTIAPVSRTETRKQGERLFARLDKQSAPFYYALELSDRTCGDSIIPRYSMLFFIEPQSPIDLGAATLEPRTKYMVLQERNAATPCIYVSLSPSPVEEPDSPPSKTTTPESDTFREGSAVNSNSTELTEERACFPGDATVKLDDGRLEKMSALQLGDRVAVGPGLYSEVFMFTHRLDSETARYIELTTASGAVIALTPGHYLYANGRSTAARNVQPGDTLELADGSSSPVVSARIVIRRGIYNPQTVLGNIVVDGVLASTYTSAVPPTAAHSLLSPLRAIFRSLGLSTTLLDAGSDVLASFAPLSSAVY